MPPATTAAVEQLTDLIPLIQNAEGFPELLAALHAGHSGTVDGAWGSSSALAVAVLGRNAPHTVLVVIAHPRDVDPWSTDLLSFSGVRPVVFPAWDGLPGDRPEVETAG
jgi:transcription-repair coupling factor (superfamily II helicase)